MKHPQNPRRGRGRSGPTTGSSKRHMPSKNRNFESNGGETKVRGNAQQVLDKYQAMARDASSAGEHILAEGYWQHAEHYFRILNADRDDRPVNKGNGDNANANANNNGDNTNTNNNGGDAHSANGGNKPRVEPSSSREIRIETQASDSSAAQPATGVAQVQIAVQPQSDGQERQPQPVAKPRRAPRPPRPPREAQPQPVVVTEQPAVVQPPQAVEQPVAVVVQPQAAEQPVVQVQPEAEKPKRRGRPRKVKVEDTADAPSAKAPSDTVSV